MAVTTASLLAFTYRRIDGRRFRGRPCVYLSVLLLTLINADFARLLPWRHVRFEGMPTGRMQVLALVGSFAQDLPVLIVQIYFVTALRKMDAAMSYVLVVSIVSLSLTLISIFWRGLRR